jgi:hypothetical protein
MKAHLSLLAIAVLTMGATNCSHPIPKIDIKIWSGDSETGSIRRSQEGEMILAMDGRFNNYACMTYDDLKKVYETLLQCKKWKRDTDLAPAYEVIQGALR